MAQALLRVGTIGDYDAWTLVAGATKVAAVDVGPDLVHDDNASFLQAVTSADLQQSFYILPSTIPAFIAAVQSLEVGIRVAQEDNGVDTPVGLISRARLNGVDSSGGSVAPAPTTPPFTTGWVSGLFSVPRPGGGAWQPADLTNTTLQIGILAPNNANAYSSVVTSIWGLLTYTPGGQGVESFREVISRRLRLRRLPHGLLEITVPTLEFADVGLGQPFCLSHPELPGADLTGAHVKPWQRWPIVKLSSTINEHAGTETMIVRDLREVLCTFWNMGKSTKSPIVYGDGIARLDAGNSRTWRRSSSALARTPGDTLVTLAYDTDHVDKDGELYQSASTNEIVQSGFKNGATDVFTGHTKAGTGSNGSNIVEDASELLFDAVADPTLPKRSVKFVGGNPSHAADLELTATATASMAANTIARASIWHKDDSGAALYYAIQRAFDSNWWRESDQTWQASKTWNPMTVTTARDRYKSKQINVGANATTLTLRVGIPTPGVAGQVNHLYHEQLEKKNFVTSAIFTEGAIAARAADYLSIGNPSNAPAWPPDRGTFRCRVLPNWSYADLAAGELKAVAYVRYGSTSEYDAVYYLQSIGAWRFERKTGGVAYQAVFVHSPVARTEYEIAARWTSSLGDLGLANYTLSVFVNKVKGTDAVAVASVVSTDSVMEIGSSLGVANFDGNIWCQEITQQALSDAQVARY